MHANELSHHIASDNIETQKTVLIDLISRITISPKDLTLELRRDILLPECIKSSKPKTKDNIISLTYPLQMKRRGVETKLIIGGVALSQPDPELIKLIAKARDWYDRLKSGDYTSQLEIAVKYKLDGADVSRIFNLAFLSPKIISAVIAGKHPVEMTAQSLKMAAAKLPISWNDQAKQLGFSA